MIIKSAVCEFVESLYRDWWLTLNAAAVDSSNTLKAKLTFSLSNVEGQQALEVNLGANLTFLITFVQLSNLFKNCFVRNMDLLKSG